MLSVVFLGKLSSEKTKEIDDVALQRDVWDCIETDIGTYLSSSGVVIGELGSWLTSSLTASLTPCVICAQVISAIPISLQFSS